MITNMTNQTVYAILRPNRVIRAMTIDPNIQIAPDETKEVWPNPQPFAPGQWHVLNLDGTHRVATLQEVDEAGVNPVLEAAKRQADLQALRDAIQAAIDDGAIPNKLKVLFRAWKKLL